MAPKVMNDLPGMVIVDAENIEVRTPQNSIKNSQIFNEIESILGSEKANDIINNQRYE
jgi:hypothetical protein